MKLEMATRFGRAAFALGSTAAALLVFAPRAYAKVTRIVIDTTFPGPIVNEQTKATVVKDNYELMIGRAFGELDPNDPHNTIITDINLGKDADGKVRYIATFQIVKPKKLSDSSGFMWHDVPNRGGRITIAMAEQNLGDIGLSSAWQATTPERRRCRHSTSRSRRASRSRSVEPARRGQQIRARQTRTTSG